MSSLKSAIERLAALGEVEHNPEARPAFLEFRDALTQGKIRAAEKINDGTAVNLGTMERIRVIDAVNLILEYAGKKAEIKLRPEMPTGPLNRVADNSLAKKLLGWEPRVLFREGARRTLDWYFATKDKKQVTAILNRMLTER